MIRPRDSLPSLAPAPSRDFPSLRRVLPFTLPYRMHMAGAVLALLVSSAAVLGLGQGLRRLVDEGFKSGDVATLAAFGAYAEETVNAIRTVQAFTHEAMDRARFGTRVETAFAVARQRIAVRAVLTGIVILLAFGSIALVLWIGGRDVLAGRIS